VEGKWCAPLFWTAMRFVSDGPKAADWTGRSQAAYTALVANTHWPQARQARHDASRPNECQLCGGAPGTMWHRRYEFPASDLKRQQCASAPLLRAARVAGSSSPFAAEMFARGIFPSVEAQLPRSLAGEEAEGHWINRPVDGRMSGTLFSDGSGSYPTWPQLRRGGWSLVHAGMFWELVSAAYGPVPPDMEPQPVARDGEDYAVYMTTMLATPPFEIYVDCNGTLECMKFGEAYTTRADNPRAHLMTRFYAQLKGEDVGACKTLAHAALDDVHNGLSTHWEWKANAHADRLAKLWVLDHGLTNQVANDWSEGQEGGRENTKSGWQ
jgi:hypothetical protein